MASGRPVIAFARGGALETVVDGRTGLFFHEQSAQALIDAMARFEADAHAFRTDVLQSHAGSFDTAVFRARLAAVIDALIAGDNKHLAS